MATTASLPASVATSPRLIFRLPWDVFACVFLMIATCSYVTVEPAPCDVMFMLAAPLLAITGRFVLVRNMNPLLILGLCLFFVMNTVSLALAFEPWVSLRYYLITVYLILYFLMLVSLVARYGEPMYRVINGSFQIAAVITSAIGVLAGLRILPNWNDFMLTENGERIRSTFKDANVLGPFLVAAAAMLLADVFLARRIRWWQLGCLILYSVAILMTYSRGAYLAGFVTVATMVSLFWLQPAFRTRTESRLIRLMPIFMLICLAGVFVLQATDLTDFFINRFSYQSYDDERFENQQHILRTIGQVPLGIGPGSWNLHNYLHDVHSLFLRTWVEHGELGLIGLLCFLLAYCRDTLRAAFRRGPYQPIYIVCFAVFLGIMSNSFSIDTVHWRHLFLFMAIPIGLIVYESKKTQPD